MNAIKKFLLSGSRREIRTLTDKANNLRISRDIWRDRFKAQADQSERIQEKYQELIYAVESKFPDEDRHQTALRYIQAAEKSKRLPSAADRKGIFLTVDYQRISATDRPGMVDVECEGDEVWIYADAGFHHGAQCENQESEKRVMEFGSKLAALVREHFGPVRPII